jgi:hypothetical protein
MLNRRGPLNPINPPLNRVKPLVLPSSLHHNIGKLLESCLDTSDALIDILQLRLHSEECRQS